MTEDTPQSPEPTAETIRIDSIDQGEQLIRVTQDDDEIVELAADIAAHGLLQAIGVRPGTPGRWQLLYGARRLLAHQRLQRTHIRATIHRDQTGSVRAVAARENMMRRALTLREETDVVRTMHLDENRSPEQIASLLSRSRSWVLRRLAVDALPLDLRQPLLDGDLPLAHAEALARIDDDGLRRYALNQVLTTGCNVTDCRAMVEAIKAAPTMGLAVQAGIDAATNPAPISEILMRCAACGTARPIPALRLIRVCDAGCEPTDAPTPEAHNGTH